MVERGPAVRWWGRQQPPFAGCTDEVEVPGSHDRSRALLDTGHDQLTGMGEARSLQPETEAAQVGGVPGRVGPAACDPHGSQQFGLAHACAVVDDRNPGITTVPCHVNPDGCGSGSDGVVHQVGHGSLDGVSEGSEAGDGAARVWCDNLETLSGVARQTHRTAYDSIELCMSARARGTVDSTRGSF